MPLPAPCDLDELSLWLNHLSRIFHSFNRQHLLGDARSRHYCCRNGLLVPQENSWPHVYCAGPDNAQENHIHTYFRPTQLSLGTRSRPPPRKEGGASLAITTAYLRLCFTHTLSKKYPGYRDLFASPSPTPWPGIFRVQEKTVLSLEFEPMIVCVSLEDSKIQ